MDHFAIHHANLVQGLTLLDMLSIRMLSITWYLGAVRRRLKGSTQASIWLSTEAMRLFWKLSGLRRRSSTSLSRGATPSQQQLREAGVPHASLRALGRGRARLKALLQGRADCKRRRTALPSCYRIRTMKTGRAGNGNERPRISRMVQQLP